MKQIILLLLTTLFAVSGSAGAPLPDTTATPLSYQTTTQLDPKTHIQRTTLDPQGYELEVYFEVPIFEESTQGGKSINAFFYELNEAFFTPDNENLKRIWEGITLHEVNATPYFYRWNAHVNTQTEQLVSVSIAYEWYAGGVVDYGSDSYTFRAGGHRGAAEADRRGGRLGGGPPGDDRSRPPGPGRGRGYREYRAGPDQTPGRV